MKKLILSFVAIIMVAGLSSKVMAQTTDTKANDANAQILSAIVLTAAQDLEFGGIVPSTGGTVVIDNADGRTKTGTVTLVPSNITPKSGAYTVSGTKLATYVITIPTASFDITNTSDNAPHATMPVTSMTCSKGTLTLGHVNSQFDGSGADNFKVGGTLTVGPSQVPGVYTGTFDVTVAY